MSYHRGGHPGAVAVSYSTSTMAPLSPSRRYSGSNGTSTGGTSSTSGSSTTKYSFRSSGGDRTGSYYSSASTTGYRTSSFTSSSDSYRRPYISPARSVSSYNETGSIVGSSAGSLRYGSASSSSASSTTSSTSSSASRDRNGLHHPTPGSLATSTADLYAKYSPTNYVPNIYGSSGNTTSSIGNGHWRPSSSNSSSGNSSNILAELHGGDEYDSCRERRGRSYSSEASSGIGLSSNNSSKSNAVSPGLAERLSTRREAKRRTTPVLGSGGTVLAGHAHHDSAPAPTEVTLITDGKNNISDSSSSSGSNRRAAATTSGASVESSPLTKIATATAVVATSITDEKIIDSNGQTDNNCQNDDVNPDNRDLDNNNAQNNNNNNNDRDLILERDNGALEQRRRRRRGNLEQPRHNGQTDYRDDNNETININNETVVARNNRDFNDESNCSERSKIIGIGSTSGDSRAVNHHHGRTSAPDESRGVVVVVVSDSVTSVASSVADIANNAVNTVASVVTSPSSSASSLSSVSPTSETSASCAATTSSSSSSSSSSSYSTPPIVISNGESRGGLASGNTTKKSSVSSVTSSVANSSDGGGGGAGGDADHHRTAYTWTKIPTNPDNTELLTNNNGQDREAAVLGIVDAGRVSETSATTATTRIRERTTTGTSGARKSLLWTATNEIDGDIESRDVNTEGNERKDVRRSSFLSSAIPVVIKNDDNSTLDNSGVSNGLANEEINGEDSNTTIYDLNREESNGITLRINGVTERPSGTRSDDPGKPSTSRRTLFGWNDPTIDDLTAPSSSASASSSTATSNSVPVAVHQNLYRGLNEQIDESSNSRPPRNRLQSRRDERYGLNGLRNIGNTCFMNSVIQCLSNTRPLLEYLLNEQHLHDINTTTSSMKGALIKAFGQVIHELWDLSGDHVVNTTALKSQIQRFAPRFMGYSQQDAQEFLRYLLEGLHEDVNRVTVKPQPILTDIPDHYSDSHKAAESWKRYLRSEDSTIVDVFVGQLRSSLCCTSCDHVSVTLDPFWDLSLPIPARSGTVKLNQCLEHFTKVETMDGDEKPTCSKCQMRRKCTKSFSIQKFPKILVIHLKRFSPTERFRGKLSVLVDFPLTGLDLSAFAAPGVQGCTYNLYGVANHSGTTYSGHYTAYCKHPYSGEWHEYNDNRVSSVPARSVVSSEAYVLFYEQQPLNPHL